MKSEGALVLVAVFLAVLTVMVVAASILGPVIARMEGLIP